MKLLSLFKTLKENELKPGSLVMVGDGSAFPSIPVVTGEKKIKSNGRISIEIAFETQDQWGNVVLDSRWVPADIVIPITPEFSNSKPKTELEKFNTKRIGVVFDRNPNGQIIKANK